MRIHCSNNVTSSTISTAVRAVGAWTETLTEHGSRKRDHAFELKLTGTSNRRPNGGNRGAGDDYAATWDQWGAVIAAIFAADPEATMTYYPSAAAFDAFTRYRFDGGILPDDAHGDHTFRHDPASGLHKCTKCSAAQDWQALNGAEQARWAA